jgi:hypothetical protein
VFDSYLALDGNPEMKRLKSLLKQTEFHILILFLSLVLFSWPFLASSFMLLPERLFVYFFLVWGLIIFVLFLMSGNSHSPPQKEPNEINSEK